VFLGCFNSGVGVVDSFFAVLLGFFISVIFLLLHVSRAEMELSIFALRNWFPAVIIGMLLQFHNFFIFATIIIVTEIIWWFFLQKAVISKFFSQLNKSIEIKKTNNNNKADMIDGLSELLLDKGKTQQIIRSKTESGIERLEGYFLVEFIEGQLVTSVHIPFYPVFEELLGVDVYLVEVADVKLTVAKKQRFGVRVDLKRENKNADKVCLVVIVSGR
jgi:hypothetical protein